MGKKKRNAARAKLPRNTVTFSLDGTDAEVLASYRAAQAHLRFWIFCQSPFRVRVGNHILFTTPTSGTFYYAVTYNGQYVVFVIIARTFWLVGFYNTHGFFQMIWEEERLYMDDPETLVTGFDGNHGRISGANVEQTKLGIQWVRKGVTGISEYRGPNQRPEPEDFRSGIGRIVTFVMESKYGEIFRRCCGSLTGEYSQNRLGGGGASYLVHHWNSNSEEAMSNVDQGHECAEEIEETVEILNELSILQLDAYNGGVFTHDPLPPLPRGDTWEAIDNGIGDKLVGRPQTGRGRFGPPPTAHRNAARKTQSMRSGLRGGGAGGESEASSWFTEWSLGDKKDCNLVVEKARAMGLKILEAELFVKKKNQTEKTTGNDSKGSEDKNQTKARPGSGNESEEDKNQSNDPLGSSNNGNGINENKNRSKAPTRFSNDGNENEKAESSKNKGKESEEKTETPPISSGNKSSAQRHLQSDIEELQGQGFVSDSNINRFFHNLSESFGGDGLIQFANTDSTQLLTYGGEGAEAHLGFHLDNPLFTLFPVNDNDNHVYGQSDGTHWSLLILDNTGARPRLIHHDSLGGANTQAAHRLATAIRRVLPTTQEGILEARVPRQRNGWDCAIFVMAMAMSIARWWANGDEGNWMKRLHNEVNSSSVATLRLQLVEMLLGNITFADLEEV